MKKIIIGALMFWLGMIVGGIIVFNNIRIDAINEVDNGIVTIECFGHYFDYYYERGN